MFTRRKSKSDRVRDGEESRARRAESGLNKRDEPKGNYERSDSSISSASIRRSRTSRRKGDRRRYGYSHTRDDEHSYARHDSEEKNRRHHNSRKRHDVNHTSRAKNLAKSARGLHSASASYLSNEKSLEEYSHTHNPDCDRQLDPSLHESLARSGHGNNDEKMARPLREAWANGKQVVEEDDGISGDEDGFILDVENSSGGVKLFSRAEYEEEENIRMHQQKRQEKRKQKCKEKQQNANRDSDQSCAQ